MYDIIEYTFTFGEFAMTIIIIYKIIYGICLATGLLSLGFISLQRPGRFQQSIFKPLITAVLTLLGYWFRICATTEGELVIAQKLIFLGSCFTFYLMFLFVAKYCNVTIKRERNFFLCMISIVLAIITFTYDMHGLVYSSVSFTNDGGIPRLVTHPAFVLHIYRATFALYTLSMLLIATFYSRQSKRKNSNRRSRQALIIVMIPVFSALALLLELIISPTYSFIPIIVTVGIVLMMVLIYQGNIYDINDTAREEAFNHIHAAVISISATGRFQSCNALAARMFPELSGLAVNERLTDDCFSEIIELLLEEKEEKFFDGRIYENMVQKIEDNGVLLGRIIWLTDVTAQREIVSFMKDYEKELEHLVDEKTRNIIEMQNHVMMSMSDIIENRDVNTGGHVKRTSDVVGLLINAMRDDAYPGLSSEMALSIARTAPLHDLGKLAIDDAILRKPGKLTDEEYAIMKTHSVKGAAMIDKILTSVEDENILNLAHNIAKYHHEKWDGTGYPERLAGNAIPLEARVMAIVDVYDALVSKRCYKEPMSFEKANEIIMSSFGTAFDPSLQKYYLQCRDAMEAYYEPTRQ